MKKVLTFLKELYRNNNRDWFAVHKEQYKEAEAIFNAFAEKLIREIGLFDPSVQGLTVKECTYRIYCDTRFSKDKTPYKTHMGVYICPGGKKSGNAGYYFHIEPAGEMIGHHLMSTGLYMPDSKALRSVRDEIFDNSAEFLSLMNQAAGFALSQENKLKRTPTGFPSGSPMDEYLKLKDVYLERSIDERILLEGDLAAWAGQEFRKTYEFNRLLNRCVTFAREEM